MMEHKNYCPVRRRTSSMFFMHEEIHSFFKLFDDDLIQDFLRRDCCYKISDKYLIAMTFVYFKRAHFTIAEYTQRNFFLALYLANAMEEDNENGKYEIFPWALGRKWRKHISRFLKQRDKLWARIDYRAAVSRTCCEEVMSIRFSHFVWQRQRSEHHFSIQREYNKEDLVNFPLGPCASPVPCAYCKRSRLSLDATPPRPAPAQRRTGEANSQTRHLSWFSSEEVPRSDLACETTHDFLMDLFNEK